MMGRMGLPVVEGQSLEVEQLATADLVVSNQENSIVVYMLVHKHYYNREGMIVEVPLVVAWVAGPFHHNSWVHMKGRMMQDTVLDTQSTLVVQTSVRHNNHYYTMGNIGWSMNRNMYLLAQVLIVMDGRVLVVALLLVLVQIL